VAAGLLLEDLEKSCPGPGGSPAVKVLDKIRFTARAGSITGIVGLNGCGKTTLLRIIAGLEPADAGRIRLEGEGAGGIGMVFQEVALLPWRTVRRNISLGLELNGTPEARRGRIVEGFLSVFGLEENADQYPRELSGGTRQKTAIARALAPGPGVVLMDEPFSALDAQTRDGMQKFLLRVWTERRDTILFVTHNIEEAVYMSDQVVIITPKPARVAAVIPVPLPRPRDKTGPECNLLRREIFSILHKPGASPRME
jgi:NitT/TauT family transport system ATP-binding protein